MKRQRNIDHGNYNYYAKPTKADHHEGKTTRTKKSTMGKRKGKSSSAVEVPERVEEERKINYRDGESRDETVMEKNVQCWEDQYWPWFRGSSVDEQMSWGSIWLPFWDVDYMGEACREMFSDVVWDDDIWNLKGIDKIPNEQLDN